MLFDSGLATVFGRGDDERRCALVDPACPLRARGRRALDHSPVGPQERARRRGAKAAVALDAAQRCSFEEPSPVTDTALWPVRPVPGLLRERSVQTGAWTIDTLGALVDRSLTAVPDAGIHIWSESRPWHGTYTDIHAEGAPSPPARCAAGLEQGDVVAFQLPNWHEAVVAFYALAMGGYVLVPIVHI